MFRDNIQPNPSCQGQFGVCVAARVEARVGDAGATLEGTEPSAQRVRLDGGAVGLGADPTLVDVGRTEGEPLLGTLSLPTPEQGTHLLAHDDGALSPPLGGRPDVDALLIPGPCWTDELVEQLAVFNRNHCRPPKPEANLRRIARWVVAHDSTTGLLERPSTDPVASSWAPVDLAPVLDGTAPATIPGVLERTDGVRLLYRGKRHLLAGEPEAGKGWIAMRACSGRIALGEQVLYLDFEDDEEASSGCGPSA